MDVRCPEDSVAALILDSPSSRRNFKTYSQTVGKINATPHHSLLPKSLEVEKGEMWELKLTDLFNCATSPYCTSSVRRLTASKFSDSS